MKKKKKQKRKKMEEVSCVMQHSAETVMPGRYSMCYESGELAWDETSHPHG